MSCCFCILFVVKWWCFNYCGSYYIILLVWINISLIGNFNIIVSEVNNYFIIFWELSFVIKEEVLIIIGYFGVCLFLCIGIIEGEFNWVGVVFIGKGNSG